MPTARVFLPAGSVGGTFDGAPVTVPALVAGTITEPVVPDAQVVVTGDNGPAGLATYEWSSRPTPGSGSWTVIGTDAALAQAPGGGIEIRRGVAVPAQAMVYTPGVTVQAAAAARPEWVMGASLRLASPSPQTFLVNASALQAGDRLIAVLSQNGLVSDPVTNVLPSILRFNGVDAPARLFHAGTATENNVNRAARVWQYVMPGAGSTDWPIEADMGGNNLLLTIWGVRGGQYASHAYTPFSGRAGGAATFVEHTITPASLDHILLSSLHSQSNLGSTLAWTDMTRAHNNNALSIQSAGATREDADTTPQTIRADFTPGFNTSGHLLTLCVENF